jgi:protein MAK11
MDSKKRARTDDMNDTEIAKKKQILDKVTSSNSLLPTEALLQSDDEDFRVVVGTYERLLYGINARWNQDVSH